MPKKIPTVLSNVVENATSTDTKQARSSVKTAEIKTANWYMFTFSFLTLASMGCDNLLSNKVDPWDRGMVISIIFNLKHSLEVVLKTISNHLNESFDPGHDVQDLVSKLKKRIKGRKNAREINECLQEFDELLVKYRQFKLFKNVLKDSIVFDDKSNKLFKYPDNNKEGGIVLDINYSELVSRLTKSDLREIKSDITKIMNNLGKIKSILKD